MDVGIVGAGPAGLFAAIALRRLVGAEVAVYERAETLRAVGAGLLLQPTGLAALAALDVRETVVARGSRIAHLLGTSAEGQRVMDMRYARLGADVHGIGIHRPSLHAALVAAARDAGVVLRLGCAVDGLRDAHDGVSPTVRGEALARHALLVLADGTHSILREAAGLRATVRPYPWAALWCTLPGHATGDTLRQYYRSAREMMGLLPSGIDLDGAPVQTFFWSIPAGAFADWRAQPLAAWRRRLVALAPEHAERFEAIDAHDRLAFARYADVRLPVPWAGRVVAIGDAAHATSPQLGQGVNLALLDGLALARALRVAPDPTRALPAYAAARRAHVRYYQWASRILTPLFQSERRVVPWLRDRFMATMLALPWVDRQAAHTLAGTKTGILSAASDADALLRRFEFSP